MASAEIKRKKKRNSNDKHTTPTKQTTATRPPKNHRSKRTPETHQQALDLSHQLRQLSNQKRLRECIALYNSSKYDDIRDVHHGSIVIDCCARCGDVSEAERIVRKILDCKAGGDEDYIWDKYDQIPYRQMPIQAWTALLKGYVHSGMMAKADSLFCALCVNGDGVENDDTKKRKRSEMKHDSRANVRTLNTLLRGCLWSATSINNDYKRSGIDQTQKKSKKKARQTARRNEFVGGVVTAERAWKQFGYLTQTCNTSFDSSSYEYFITLLCQSLQCTKTEQYLNQMKEQFHLTDDLVDSDPNVVESFVVCLVALARACALYGKVNDVQRYTESALKMIQYLESATSASETYSAEKKSRVATGGKQAWKSGTNTDGSGRREQSNTLFRSHRISELKTEATVLSQYSNCHENNKILARIMMTKLFYFSGGGTTGLNANTDTNSVSENQDADYKTQQATMQWYNSLWFSFGLEATINVQRGQKFSDLNTSSNKGLNSEVCNSLRNLVLGKGQHIIKINGCIDFKQVFFSANANPGKQVDKPLHIELGSGSGDWASIQAKSNPSDNYITVELRADRVAQTFAKAVLHNQANTTSGTALSNLCCVGSECGSFLRERIEPETIRTIFVNHPEPPTQTSTSDDNQAHMLNSETLLAAAKCLEPDGRGRIIIVTDNLIYARLIGNTMAKILNHGKLSSVKPYDVSDLGKFDVVSDPNSPGSIVHIYEGKPSLSIGHHTPKSSIGTSYFDRLWRTGAGKHADMKRRFIIAVRTKGKHDSSVTSKIDNQPKKSSESINKSKSNKKRSAEKQKRRNERRLLKKQQQNST